MKIKNRKQPQENFERNKKLISDYKKNMLIIDMVAKYRISSTRIYQIINAWEKKHEKKELSK